MLEPHSVLLRDRNPGTAWQDRLAATFDSRVRGPAFEEQARQWVRRYADPATIGGPAGRVGPSFAVIGRVEHQLDVVVTAVEPVEAPASERAVLAIGEAKAGETVGAGLLAKLQQARSALGARAAHAKLLLFGPEFTTELVAVAAGRADVELVDLERLYHGS